MPTPSRKTPQRITTMLDMHGRGASSREIGEALGMSHHTIGEWLRDAGLTPNGGHGTRKGRKRHEAEGPAAELADMAREVAAVTSAPLPRNREEALAHVQARLAMAAKLIEQQARGLPTGSTNPATLVKLGQWERELRAEIAELTPRTNPDPEHDPANVEAAAAVRTEIESLAEAVERSLVCAHCGRNPFRKAESA
jgi:hypothetical protein